MHVADRLQAAMDRTGSIACVGLDPRPDLVPPDLAARALDAHPNDARRAVAAAFVEANTRLISAIAGRCAAVKPQVACYEAYGAAGWAALASTVELAHEAGLEVVLDGKRGDIGSTATHYAQAMFGGAPGLDGATVPGLGGDWATVNGYLGRDNVCEFLRPDSEHGVLVLTKTSNPGSGELQDLRVANGTDTVAEAVGRLVDLWGAGRRGASGLTDVGAVVGCTYPDEARRLREVMPDALFLVPGYGSQGGNAAGALAGARDDGRGVLVSSSRAILGAWQSAPPDTNWVDACRAALDDMNAALAAAQP